MKKYLLSLMLLGLSLSFCKPEEHLPLITAEQLLFEMNEDPNVWVINVLGRRLYSDCHIPGSINVPLRVIERQLTRWRKDQPIIVYCALDECDASEKAYELLTGHGFTNVRAYEGGIREWHLKGLPVNGPCSLDYLKRCECIGKDKPGVSFKELEDDCS